MEEKISDNICGEVFHEFYINRDYLTCLKKGKRAYRLLIKNGAKSSKDNYYLWMILIVIVKSYKKLDKIEKSFKYILLGLRVAKEESRKTEVYYQYLIEYYLKVGNPKKEEYYLERHEGDCRREVKRQNLEGVLNPRF